MDMLTTTVIAVSAVLHGGLLVYAQLRGVKNPAERLWLALTLICGALAALAFLLPAGTLFVPPFSGVDRGFWVMAALAALLTAFGALVMRDMLTRIPRVWLIGGGVWIAGLVIAALLSPPSGFGAPDWLLSAFNAPTALVVNAFLGLLLMSLGLLGAAFYAFYNATLPEVANRALYWVGVVALLLTGIVLAISGSETLIPAGVLLLLLASTGAAYAQVSYRVFDIRREFGTAVRTLLIVIVTALVIATALLLAGALELRDTPALALLALLTALIYYPLRLLIEWLVDLLIRGANPDAPAAIRSYSQQIGGAVELPALADAATRTLSQIMQVRRAALLVVNDTGSTENAVELQLLPGDGKTRGYLHKSGLLYRVFAEESRTISQFDLEFNPRFRAMPPGEFSFFRDTGLSAYAPIVFENALIGVLACGTKTNDAPFNPRDFELLTALANQTGAALRNARLVADLRKLYDNMRALNASLESAKTQVEKLDSVKTDFITIASHELRTPLAQLRGYTDIIDALNEQGSLDRDQTAGMVSNLRKATERMEELIGAMLDVSQLDVNAMDLRFTQTSLEAVVRMAIEPLTDAIRQRKLTLSARGLRGLPMVQADMQRLVQAFRNVVVNAIKFTPDGGRIDIRASLKPAEQPGAKDHVQITITDTGVGIAPENLELIFRKFFRAYDPGLHSTGTYKFMGAGPGLGLTIAQGVVVGHGGRIWAESPGHSMENCPGATFHIVLPVTPPEDARRVLPFQGEDVAAEGEAALAAAPPRAP